MKKLLIVLLLSLALMGCQNTETNIGTNTGTNVDKNVSVQGSVLNSTFDTNLFEGYLADIEDQTGKRIYEGQRQLILDYVLKNPITKIDTATLTANRKDFDKKRESLIEEWELRTHQKWPTYQQNVLSDKGKVLRKVGDNYDAHHVIELSYGGRNEWWNLIPAAFPNEHQGGIHRKDGPASKIFGKIDE